MNDRDDYTNSDLFINHDSYLDNNEYILADGGFVNGPGLLVPIHKTVLNSATDDEYRKAIIDYNKEFTSNRLIVEDVFSWLKSTACILNTAYPRHLDTQAGLFKAACRLHNFKRMFRMEYALQLPATNANQSQ